MADELSAIVASAEAEISATSDLKQLDDIRVTYLGKKGSLTEQMKTLGRLSAEERPAAGQAINQAKQAVQKALEEKKNSLQLADLAQRLAAESVDVTLPGR
ncbi:MAG: phenylalanine--tRNA ligase subunit alpha, partial [Gammaproteobacteria bacterium]|nr:phenylalanine--tRNA ligase subunit alpha [Gammaproteobacteria bacterium]